MGIFDKILGTGNDRESPPQRSSARLSRSPAGNSTDQQALERYRYLLRTAPPDAVEQAHEEAFARLTPEQRRLALQELSAQMPEYERASTSTSDDPRNLAKMATRAEMRQPGTLERVFGSAGGGIGMGSMLAGSFLSSVAGAVAGSMIAQQFLGPAGFGEGLMGDGLSADPESTSVSDESADAGGFGDAGGDFGGGDFGGGDFEI